MRLKTVRALAALNARFYAEQARSFSDTRRAPWPGWRACLPHLRAAAADGGRLRVLDVGCGNLRFEAFLTHAMPTAHLDVLAVDACEPLMEDASALPGAVAVRTMTLDVVGALAGGGAGDDGANAQALARRFGEGLYDASVAFGFLHHVPSARLRAAALEALVASARPGGVVAASLWRFLDDPAFARKADDQHAAALRDLVAPPGSLSPRIPVRCKASTAGVPAQAFPTGAFDPAELEPGDRVLGWQGKPGAYRYCHGFSDADVEALVAAVADRADLAARFRADGRTGELNEYLVFRVR